MSYWAGLRASIKELKALLAAEADPRRATRLDAAIKAQQALFATRPQSQSLKGTKP